MRSTVKRTITIVIIGVFAAVLAGGSYFVLSKQDFLGGVVYGALDSAISEKLNAKLSTAPLDGNPLTGMHTSGTSLSRSGDKLVTVKDLDIKLSLPSLLKGSPRVAKLTVEGLSSDVESLNRLVPESKSSEPTDIPIDKIIFKNCRVSTEYGVVELGDSTLHLKGSQWFSVDARGRIKDISSFAVSGIVSKEKGTWTADNVNIKLDSGTAHVNGGIYPSPDAQVETKELNISKIAALFPEVRKFGVHGILTGKASVRGTGRDMAVKGSVSMRDALIHGVPLESLTASVDYDKGLLKAKVDSGKVFKSMLSGRVTFDTRGGKRFLDLDLHAKDLYFADWTDKFGKELGSVKTLPHGKITAMSAKIKGPLDALVGSLKVEPSNIGYSKYELKGVQGTAQFSGKPSGTVDFSAMHKGKKLTLKGTISFADKVPTDLAFTSDGFDMAEVSDAVPALSKYGAKGYVSVKAAVKGFVKKWDLRAELSSDRIAMKKFGEVRSLRASGGYSFTDGSFALKNFSALWNGAKVSASGRTDASRPGTALSFSGSLSDAKTDKFYEIFEFMKTLKLKTTVSGKFNVSGTAKNIRAQASLNTPGGRMFDLRIDSFTAGLLYKDGILTAPMKITAAGGSADAKCTVKLTGAKTKWDVYGKLTSVDLTAFNGLLSISEDIKGPADGTMRIYDDGGGFRWKANIARCKGIWRGFHVDSLTGAADGDTKKIQLRNLKVSMFRGSSTMNGSVTLAPKGKPATDADIDISLSAEKLNIYEILRRHLSALRGIQGLVSLRANVRGKASDPHFYGKGLIAPFKLRGLLLPMLDADIEGNLRRIHLANISARLRSGELTGRGYIYQKGGEWRMHARVKGREVDMNQIGRYLPDKFRKGFAGLADFDMRCHGPVNNISGSGNFTSKSMKVLGIQFSDVNAPFFLDGGYAVVEDMKAQSNNGKVTGGVAYDINKSYWGANLTVASADVESMMKQLKPDLSGKITGAGDVKIRAEGETGRFSTLKGSGIFMLNNGEISGFKAIESAKKYTKGKPLRYRKVQAAFSFDGDSLLIFPGSEAIAPIGDSVYNYVMLDGIISRKGDLALALMGKVNVRALNTMLGGLQGFVTMGTEFTKGTLQTKDIAQNLLGGIISGYAKNSFRFFTMAIGGTLSKPVVNRMKVDSNTSSFIGDNAIPKSAGDPEEKNFQNGDFNIRLKFEIPVGPGRHKDGGDVTGQAVQQMFKNILSNINY